MVQGSGGRRIPSELLDAGYHFDDDPERKVRRIRSVEHRPISSNVARKDSNRYDLTQLPRENLCRKVSVLCLRRPE